MLRCMRLAYCVALMLATGVAMAAEAVPPRILIDEADTIALLKGAQVADEPTKSGKVSAFLAGAEKGEGVTYETTDADWSAYNTLSFWLHSAASNDAQIFILLNSRKDTQVFSYFYTKLTIDWRGWKRVEIPFERFKPSRNPAGWRKIDNLMLCFKGWNIEPKGDTRVHIDDVELVLKPVPPPRGLTGASEYEQEVYRRYYKANVEKNYVRHYGGMSYDLIQKNPTTKRYEIDPGEFERDLETKKAALEEMRKKRIAEFRAAPIPSLRKRKMKEYIAKLDDAEYFDKMKNAWALIAVAQAVVQMPEYQGDKALRLRVYRAAITSLGSVLAEPKWPSGCFGQPHQAGMIYYTLHDLLQADMAAGGELGEVAEKLELVCRDMAYLAWIFPYSHNSGMRMKHPYSVNTFRYSTGYTVGNFGYRYVVDCALIHRDTKMLDIVKRVVLLSLHNVTSYNTLEDTFWFNQGFMADGTGTAHGRQSYAFGYVDDYVQGGAYRNASLLKGTPWDIGTEHWDLVGRFLLEAEQWIVYRGRIDPSVNGRHNLYSPNRRRHNYAFHGDSTIKRLTEAVLKLSEGTVKQKAELEAMVERLGKKEDIEGNRYYWCTEDLIQRRKNFYFLANLSSVRIAGPENARPFAEKNFYFGDGATMILSEGGEYDYARGAWDFSALPGTTAADKPVPYVNTWIGFYGANIYSGGVSDGRNGAAAFRYIKPDVKVMALKSYFACDTTVAALGIVTENDADAPVRTTLNQTTWNTDIACVADGKSRTFGKGAPVDETFRASAPVAFWQDRFGYVVIPDGEAEVRLTAETRRTDWAGIAQIQKGVKEDDVDIFHLTVEHGDRDAFAKDRGNREKYQYVLRGDLDRGGFDAFAANPGVTILANTRQVQAVRFDERKIVQAAFYEAATLDARDVKIEVDKPAVVMIDESTDGEVAVTVADPLQSPMTDKLTLKIGMALRGAGVVSSGGESVLTIDLPGNPEIGKSVTEVYRR